MSNLYKITFKSGRTILIGDVMAKQLSKTPQSPIIISFTDETNGDVLIFNVIEVESIIKVTGQP